MGRGHGYGRGRGKVSEEEKAVACDMIKETAENTSIAGLPNVIRAKGWCKKIFWSILFVAAVIICVYNVALAIERYYSYPTETTVDAMVGFSQPFPAVTICNMNPLPKRKVEILKKELATTHSMAQENENSNDTSVKLEYHKKVIQLFRTYELSERKSMGHQINEMLLSCKYVDQDCGIDDFFNFQNAIYGNCYTFNHGGNEEYLISNRIGPSAALELELYIDQINYDSLLADSAGIRVVIHNQTEMAFPEDDGYSVSPGFATFIGMAREEYTLAAEPYGNCNEVDEDFVPLVNAWKEEIPYLDYTTEACKKTCYQYFVIKNCKCGDPDYPMDTEGLKATAGEYVDEWPVKSCYESNVTTDCMIEVFKLFSTGDQECGMWCVPRCHYVSQDITMSFAVWPPQDRVAEYVDTIINMSPSQDVTEKNFTTFNDKLSFIRENVLRLVIYFETLDVQTITTEPSFGLEVFLSDLGGHVGLWLGFSVLTCFEFIELIWDIIVMLVQGVKVYKKRRKERKSQRQRAEEDDDDDDAAEMEGLNQKESNA